jgi:hypothetical protein
MMTDHFSPEAAKLLLEALERGQLPFVHLSSDSMAPLFRRSDQIQLGQVDPGGPSVGDIVVTGAIDDLLAHRFWGAQVLDGNPYLLTRGDRLAHYDPYTPETQLRAIVIARRRSGRTLSLQTGPGAWLNRTLTKLARADARLMKLTPPTSIAEPGPSPSCGLVRRLGRRCLRIVVASLTAVVGLLPE